MTRVTVFFQTFFPLSYLFIQSLRKPYILLLEALSRQLASSPVYRT